MSALNINDLYGKLEEHRKLVIACETDQAYYSLRAGIYRARAKFLEAFAMIDDTNDEDGFKLVVRRDKTAGTVTIELAQKEAARQWIILAGD